MTLKVSATRSPFSSQPQHKAQTQPEPSDPQPIIHGFSVTPLTQCAHWHSPLDIIAIKHACCRKFYACISCHNMLETEHNPEVWKQEDWGEKAVFCGACKRIWSVGGYMQAEGKESPTCAGCRARWNPGCKNHWGLYFDVDGDVKGKGQGEVEVEVEVEA